MSEAIRLRCAPGRFCYSLQHALEMNNSTILGLVPLNRKRGFTRRFGVKYYANVHDNGQLINFCPFCGADFRLLES